MDYLFAQRKFISKDGYTETLTYSAPVSANYYVKIFTENLKNYLFFDLKEKQW